jgi:hypothetical protein
MRDERIHGVGAETPTHLLLLPAAAEFGSACGRLILGYHFVQGVLGTLKSLEH